MNKHLHLQQDNGIAWITIDRPERRNAFLHDMVEAMTDQAILGCADAQARVINEAGAAIRSLANPADHIHAGAVSADGKTWASAGQSGALYVWELPAGRLIATLPPAK